MTAKFLSFYSYELCIFVFYLKFYRHVFFSRSLTTTDVPLLLPIPITVAVTAIFQPGLFFAHVNFKFRKSENRIRNFCFLLAIYLNKIA